MVSRERSDQERTVVLPLIVRDSQKRTKCRCVSQPGRQKALPCQNVPILIGRVLEEEALAHRPAPEERQQNVRLHQHLLRQSQSNEQAGESRVQPSIHDGLPSRHAFLAVNII